MIVERLVRKPDGGYRWVRADDEIAALGLPWCDVFGAVVASVVVAAPFIILLIATLV